MKKRIKEVAPYKTLFVDDKTGLAMIEDGVHGAGLTLHPSIDATGSVTGMKKLGYWKDGDVTVKSFGFIHNISKFVPEDDAEMNQILLAHCKCGGNHGAPPVKEMSAEHEAFLVKMSKKAPLTSSVLRGYWEKGKRYYVDTRVDIRGLRREFNRLNDMMTGG